MPGLPQQQFAPPTREEMEKYFREKYGDPARTGWGPKLRYRFGYFQPADVYEATLAALVGDGDSWIDIGCGRDLLPGNSRLAKILSSRCGLLVGVDDSANVLENELLHEKARCRIEDYRTDRKFDLATLRMVAEHIQEPESAVQSIARLVRPGGKAVIFTINRWSPISLVSWLAPFQLHHAVKKLIWRTEEKDTFPVAYKMNTRRHLRRLFQGAGFRESRFSYLNDCSASQNSYALQLVELSLQRACGMLGLRYPENCLLGIYEKS
jgi:SAM-dependent methyltransferase